MPNNPPPKNIMYYATHRLYVSKNNPLGLHVVKVEQGRVHSFFPFDGERQSMLWVDALLISEDGTLSCISGTLDEVLDAARPSEQGCYLYSIEKQKESFSLRPL